MPSRISGACNGCRTKKQKCSGDRSGCSQCAAAGIVCTWPEQRKRGPAKGYIEGLEHRLHDAESLLLQLLPIVSPDQLASAASAANATQNGLTRDSPDPGSRSSPPTLNKKTGIDYWERFPLDTAENILRWSQDCALQSHFKDESRGGSHSRPGSVDFTSQQHMNDRKSSSLSQYRSMSGDSFRGSQDFSNVPHSGSRFNSVPQQTSSFAMQSQPAFVDPLGWQQQQQQQPQSQPQPQHHVQQNGFLAQQQPQAHHHQQQQHDTRQQHQHMNQQMGMSVPMDVDAGGAFFSGEVKRHLFW